MRRILVYLMHVAFSFFFADFLHSFFTSFHFLIVSFSFNLSQFLFCVIIFCLFIRLFCFLSCALSCRLSACFPVKHSTFSLVLMALVYFRLHSSLYAAHIQHAMIFCPLSSSH